MAFARLNNFSFWLTVPAAAMLAGSFFLPGGAPASGWTMYAPLTYQMPMSRARQPRGRLSSSL
jgi:cytochrome c oxidase subunit 1